MVMKFRCLAKDDFKDLADEKLRDWNQGEGQQEELWVRLVTLVR